MSQQSAGLRTPASEDRAVFSAPGRVCGLTSPSRERPGRVHRSPARRPAAATLAAYLADTPASGAGGALWSRSDSTRGLTGAVLLTGIAWRGVLSRPPHSVYAEGPPPARRTRARNTAVSRPASTAQLRARPLVGQHNIGHGHRHGRTAPGSIPDGAADAVDERSFSSRSLPPAAPGRCQLGRRRWRRVIGYRWQGVKLTWASRPAAGLGQVGHQHLPAAVDVHRARSPIRRPSDVCATPACPM